MAQDEFENVQRIATRVDLKERFPQSYRIIFSRSFWFILALITVGIGYFVFNNASEENPGGDLDYVTRYAFDAFMLAVIVICLVKIIYEFFFHLVYTYKIELEHFTITRGIFFRSRASFPIARINDVSLKRTFIDLLFGLYTLDVLTASAVYQFGIVEGLGKKAAVDLQTYLLAMVESTLPNVPEKEVEKVFEGEMSSETADEILHDKAENAG